MQDPDADSDEAESIASDLSYEGMLALGERIGDVKTERWKMRAQGVIDILPKIVYGEGVKLDDNDSSAKCLVCQCEYEVRVCVFGGESYGRWRR